MLRITSSRMDGMTRIKLEGKLIGPWVEECRALCAGETARGQRLAFDVSEVRFADRDGVELLRRLADAGHVERSSGFASELMRKGKEESMDGNRNGHGDRGATESVALVARLRAGQPEACEELVRRNGGAMLATAQRFLPDAAEARDALKEACLAAFRRAHECAADAELADWLHGLVVEVCVARMRSAQDRTSSIDELLPAFDPSGSHIHPVPRWTGRDRTSTELHAEVRARIDELSSPYRVVVLLADDEGLDTREIAERLCVPEVEVKARLHRARQALITLLGPVLTPRAAG